MFQNKTLLPRNPPAELEKMPAGKKAWRALLRAHDKLPAKLLSDLDRQFLIDYCVSIQLHQNALDLEHIAYNRFKRGTLDLKDLLKARTEVRMTLRLLLDYSRNLYGNPRSRGGVSPAEKEPDDPMAAELASMREILEDGE